MEKRTSKVIMVVGLGFGDEGKGSIVDYLARKHESSVVVRYNGGAQAGHSVVLADGRHHTFAQFGSGTFVPGCRTHLSAYMLVNPIFMMREEQHLRELGVTDAFERTTISRAALITNPFQVAANRLREMARSEGRHGSCGMGIGETMADCEAHPDEAIYIQDLQDPIELRRKLSISQGRKHDELCHLDNAKSTPAMRREWELLTDTKLVDSCVERYEKFAKSVTIVDGRYLPNLFKSDENLIFEGAQGVLLDQDYGFFPYVTRSSTTLKNAFTLLDGFEGYCNITKIGILRAYGTRHGPGPFPTWDPELELPDRHNCYGEWQREFRVGHLDLVMSRYALHAVGGVDEIVMTNLDRVQPLGRWKVCTSYDGLQDIRPPNGCSPAALLWRAEASANLAGVGPDYQAFASLETMIDHVSESLKTPIELCSYGPTAEDKKPR